jgi:uncharacterized membrane protein
MKSEKVIKLVTAAVMAAMTTVVTMILPIKIPFGNGGYIHPGDAFVLMSGIILGPIYGGLAAGLGSMMADLLSGYAQYAIATLIIKFVAAFLGAYSFRKIRVHSIVLAGVFGGTIVTLGYFFCDRILSNSWAAAAVGIPFNILQNVMAIILASIILPFLKKVPQIRILMEK